MQRGFPQGRGQAETTEVYFPSRPDRQGRLSQPAASALPQTWSLWLEVGQGCFSLSCRRDLQNTLYPLCPLPLLLFLTLGSAPIHSFPPTLFCPCLCPAALLTLAAQCRLRVLFVSGYQTGFLFWREAVLLSFLNEKMTYGNGPFFPRFLTHSESKDWKVGGWVTVCL